MKKLLNNPLVVALLAVLAVGVVYVQVLDPILHSPSQLATIVVQYGISDDEQAQYVGKAQPSFGWSTQMYARNPFIASHMQGVHRPYKAAEAVKPVNDIYQLSAILIGGKQPMAWVGGKLVGVGDVVGNQHVVAITQEQVVLRGSKGQRILKLHTGSRRNTP